MTKIIAKRKLVRAFMRSRKMKVFTDRYNVTSCQNCFYYLKDMPNYCPNCGQALDWEV